MMIILSASISNLSTYIHMYNVHSMRSVIRINLEPCEPWDLLGPLGVLWDRDLDLPIVKIYGLPIIQQFQVKIIYLHGVVLSI